ncbi:endonuclease/exonuclease/phosphatase family protein [Aureivirga marina]|uniref:endonuclease/exonuclease/phosphatase family protein n=1 Tax=Aureivirga marina TaxID=1182451 RepID=UPI0018C90F47|nr:hypothetical protein [Aureivirga marina]
MHKIAFYNLENFFEVHPYEARQPHEFSPNGRMKWGDYRYQKKVEKVSKAISLLEKEKDLPILFLGLAEIESKKILEDLVSFHFLKPFNFKYIHFNSKYDRGIDVAFIYNPKYLEVIDATPYEIPVKKTGTKKAFSRDILYVKGKFKEEILHIFVNHWPSKRKNSIKKENGRIIASEILIEKIQEIREENQEANIIVLGDFNENPSNDLIHNFTEKADLFNPMFPMFAKNMGSLKFQGKWHLFDQIMFSSSFLKKDSIKYHTTKIYTNDYLIGKRNEKSKEPNRTYFGKNYIGGVSDHFPVYSIIG